MMNSGCTASWQHRISDYHDGRVTGDERATIEEHIRTCEPCKQLLASYDELYRHLRQLPGFVGTISLTDPRSRRGFTSNRRPMATWPGQSFISSSAPYVQRGSGLVALLLTAMLIGVIVMSRGFGLLGPASSSHDAGGVAGPATGTALYTNSNLNSTRTIDMHPCANMSAVGTLTYLYAGQGGSLLQVQDCAITRKIGVISPSNFRLGDWSPDGKRLTVFTPDIPVTSQSESLAVWDTDTQKVTSVDLSGMSKFVSTTPSADAAIWTDNAHLVVLSKQHLFLVNTDVAGIDNLNINNALYLVWRKDQLYYSALENGGVAIHRLNIAQGINERLFSIRGTGNACPTTISVDCQAAYAWDVSPDGMYAIYQAADGSSNNSMAPFVARDITNGTQQQLFTPGKDEIPTSVRFAPNSMYYAVQQSSKISQSVVIGGINGTMSITTKGEDALRWRPDSGALVIEPFQQSNTITPLLVNVPSGTTINLDPETSDYIWR
jgi:WD40 repeat protein